MVSSTYKAQSVDTSIEAELVQFAEEAYQSAIRLLENLELIEENSKPA